MGIDGCLEWQRSGLAPPAAVLKATKDYLEAEDSVSQWLNERCAQDASYTDESSRLFANWKGWAEARGEFIGSQKRLVQALENRGFVRYHAVGTRRAMFRGIALRADQDGPL
jgi:phage/plasmid-associated DNA primase